LRFKHSIPLIQIVSNAGQGKRTMRSRYCRRFLLQTSRVCGLFAVLVLVNSAPREATGAMQRASGEREQIDRILQRYDRVRMDVEQTVRQVRETGELRFSSRDRTFDVVLEPYEIRASGYQAEEELPGGIRRALPHASVHTYRGTVPLLWDSEARFTVKDRSFEGVVLTPDEWYYIEPLLNFSPSSDPSEMVVYRRSDVRPDALGVCGTTMAHRIGEANELVESQVLTASSGVRTAEIATEADYEFVTASGGAAAANASILEVLNQVDGIYQTQLSIALRVSYQHAWSAPDDPYTSTAPITMLNEFQSYWNSNFYGTPFDLAHMWTGKDMDGSTIGIAYMSVVCQARYYSYGVSQRFTSSPGKYILSAHEIGHNFGASHPDQATPPHSECGNTIMNSFVGTGFTFCNFSISEISGFLDGSSSCLTSGPVAPSGLIATAVSSSQINLSWQDNSPDETSFLIERKTGVGGSWAQIGTTVANTTYYSDSGLGSNVTYYYRVAAAGGSGTSSYSNEAGATTLASPPTITTFDPSSGRVGAVVTIYGTNLNGATTVRFNVTNATSFSIQSPTQISATVPTGATTGTITIMTPVGSGTSAMAFAVTSSRCDINGDSSVNVLDIQLLINTILGIPGSPASCDINSDGVTNVLDLQVLINVILGLVGCPG
jgi:hypothetical protein